MIDLHETGEVAGNVGDTAGIAFAGKPESTSRDSPASHDQRGGRRPRVG